MFSLSSATFTTPSSKALCNSSSLYFLPQKSSSRVYRILSYSPSNADNSQIPLSPTPNGNYAGVQLQETICKGTEKSRLDTWISSRICGVSRARVQSSIRSGLVSVNGRIIDKVAHVIRGGDKIDCTIAELQPLSAEPEDIPIDIVYEDAHVLVVNKPAHMVVHPAPGNANGTLVNGILHHCSLPAAEILNSDEMHSGSEDSDDEMNGFSSSLSSGDDSSPRLFGNSVRPGIVHRLDKGTSGLLVVAKDEHSHAYLSEQFKQHTIHRVYISLTSGVPSSISGRIEVPIGRDVSNRIRMAALPGNNSGRQTRHAASRYKVIQVLAGGGSALVEWRLETGRTHQIRAHAKYMGIPLLGDEVYGGTKSMALSLLRPCTHSSCHGELLQLVSKLQRPCLHALALGFKHPHTGENVQYSCPPPADFAEMLSLLRNIKSL